MTSIEKKYILVAALDWGLGHASRLVPVVRELQKQGATVILTSSGRAGRLLQKECPDLPYLECPAYSIRYPSRNMYWNMFLQFPRITTTVIREQLWLRKLLQQHKIDGIISDSRFGLFHRSIPSVILAHQLRLLVSPTWFNRLVNFLYRMVLNQFDAVWVPDVQDGLSGQLSDPAPFRNTHYLGLLSRMNPVIEDQVYELLVLLSGPEPQRTRLENMILAQLKQLPHISALVIQGITDDSRTHQLEGTNTSIVSYLSGHALEKAIASAKWVVCRSGYSSLMDLAVMGKKAILIPTPGQPEQEYLAQRCQDKEWAAVVSQTELDLSQVFASLSPAIGFPAFKEKGQWNLRSVLRQFSQNWNG